MPECAVCQKEKPVNNFANSCTTHEPQVCKPCLRKWLRRTDTCPICRAVVHARAVQPVAAVRLSRKRSLSLSEEQKQAEEEAADVRIEEEYKAARTRLKLKEQRVQEREDHRMAVQMAQQENEEERRRVLDSINYASVMFNRAAFQNALWQTIFSDYLVERMQGDAEVVE